MIEFLQAVLAFVLVLAPLVFVHELGHFLAAKLFGIGVPVFSLGFGPRLFGFQRGGTDYRLSAIPLGGYVRLHGDEADQNRTGAPDEFLTRPKYQRFTVFVAGPVFNVITAFLALWFLFGIYGQDEVPVGYPTVDHPIEGLSVDPDLLRTGDKVIEIAGRDVHNPDVLLDVLRMEILLNPNTKRRLLIEREGKRQEVEVEIGSNPNDGSGVLGWSLSHGGSAVFRKVMPGGAAEQAGLLEGDTVLSVNGQPVLHYIDFRVLLLESPGLPLQLDVERGSEIVQLTLVPRDEAGQGKIGAVLTPTPPVHVDLGFAAAARESFRTNVELSKTLFVVLKRLLNWVINKGTGIDFGPQLPPSTLSGPLGIAKFARDALIAGPRDFMFLLGFFSLQLGILNLMPIPVLDGGHILILGIEGLMRREFSEKVKERVMLVGFAMLIALMSTVIVLDFFKL